MHRSLLYARALFAAAARGAAELLALQRLRLQEWLLHRARCMRQRPFRSG